MVAKCNILRSNFGAAAQNLDTDLKTETAMLGGSFRLAKYSDDLCFEKGNGLCGTHGVDCGKYRDLACNETNFESIIEKEYKIIKPSTPIADQEETERWLELSPFDKLCWGVCDFLESAAVKTLYTEKGTRHVINVLLFVAGSSRNLPARQEYQRMTKAVHDLGKNGKVQVQLNFFGMNKQNNDDLKLMHHFNAASYNPLEAIASCEESPKDTEHLGSTLPKVIKGRTHLTITVAPYTGDARVVVLQRTSVSKDNIAEKWELITESTIEEEEYLTYSRDKFLPAVACENATKFATQTITVINNYAAHKGLSTTNLTQMNKTSAARTTSAEQERQRDRQEEHSAKNAVAKIDYVVDTATATLNVNMGFTVQMAINATLRPTYEHFFAAVDTSPAMGSALPQVRDALAHLAFEAIGEVKIGTFGEAQKGFTTVPNRPKDIRAINTAALTQEQKTALSTKWTSGTLESEYTAFETALLDYLANGVPAIAAAIAAKGGVADHIIHVLLYTCSNKVLPHAPFFDAISKQVESLVAKSGIQVIFHFFGADTSTDEAHRDFRQAFSSLSTVPAAKDPQLESTEMIEKSKGILGSDRPFDSLEVKIESTPHPDDTRGGANDGDDKDPHGRIILSLVGAEKPPDSKEEFMRDMTKSVQEELGVHLDSVLSIVDFDLTRAANQLQLKKPIKFRSGGHKLDYEGDDVMADRDILNQVAHIIKALAKVAAELKIDEPKLGIDGHVVGDYDRNSITKNQKLHVLSKDRADACIVHLISCGVSAKSLTSTGLGCEKPAADGNSKRIEINLENGDDMYKQVLENIERRRKDALRTKAPKSLVYKFADTTPVLIDAVAYARCFTIDEVAAHKIWLIRPTKTVEITADKCSVEDRYIKRDEKEVAMQASVAENGKGLAASVQKKLEDELERVKSGTTVDLNYTVEAAGSPHGRPLDVSDGYLLTTEVVATAAMKKRLHVWAAVDTSPDMHPSLPHVAASLKLMGKTVYSSLSNGGTITLGKFSEVKNYRPIPATDIDIDAHLKVATVKDKMKEVDHTVKIMLAQTQQTSPNVKVDLEHDKIEILKNVEFSANSFELTGAGFGGPKRILDAVAGVIKTVATVFDKLNATLYPQFMVEGHTSSNEQTLSENRATACVNYLVETGQCKRSMLQFKGCSNTEPNLKGKADNRVEIKLLNGRAVSDSLIKADLDSVFLANIRASGRSDGESEYMSVCNALLEYLRTDCNNEASFKQVVDHVDVVLYTCGSEEQISGKVVSKRILPPLSFYHDVNNEIKRLKDKNTHVQLHFVGAAEQHNAFEETVRHAFANLSYNPTQVTNQFELRAEVQKGKLESRAETMMGNFLPRNFEFICTSHAVEHDQDVRNQAMLENATGSFGEGGRPFKLLNTQKTLVCSPTQGPGGRGMKTLTDVQTKLIALWDASDSSMNDNSVVLHVDERLDESERDATLKQADFAAQLKKAKLLIDVDGGGKQPANDLVAKMDSDEDGNISKIEFIYAIGAMDRPASRKFAGGDPLTWKLDPVEELLRREDQYLKIGTFGEGIAKDERGFKLLYELHFDVPTLALDEGTPTKPKQVVIDVPKEQFRVSLDDIYGRARKEEDLRLVTEERRWTKENNIKAANAFDVTEQVMQLEDKKHESMIGLEVKFAAAEMDPANGTQISSQEKANWAAGPARSQSTGQGLSVTVTGAANGAQHVRGNTNVGVVTKSHTLIVYDINQELKDFGVHPDDGMVPAEINGGLVKFMREISKNRTTHVPNIRIMVCNGDNVSNLEGVKYQQMVYKAAGTSVGEDSAMLKGVSVNVRLQSLDADLKRAAQSENMADDAMLGVGQYIESLFNMDATTEHNVNIFFATANSSRTANYDVTARIKNRVLELAARHVYVQTAVLGLGKCNGAFVNSLSTLNFDANLTLVEYVGNTSAEAVSTAVDRLMDRAARVNEYYPFRIKVSSKKGGPFNDPEAKTFLITAMSRFAQEDRGGAQGREEQFWGTRAIKLTAELREHCIRNAASPGSFATIAWAKQFSGDYLQGQSFTTADRRKQDAKNRKRFLAMIDVEVKAEMNVQKTIHTEVTLSEGIVKVLSPILFVQGKWTLIPESREILDEVSEVIIAVQQVCERRGITGKVTPRFVITGHCSSDDVTNGEDKDRVLLSRKRSEACGNYLVKKGCVSDQLETIGKGNDELLREISAGKSVLVEDGKALANRRYAMVICARVRARTRV